jgi:Tfp pilus assembly protein PilN
MLQTNLATRPFYNERAVRTALVAVALFALGLTAFNAVQVLRLTARNGELRQQALEAEARTRELRSKERGVRTALDKTRIDAVQAAAREANMLIDRRAFSWTDLFNRFEQTLPPDVRISAVTPQIDNEDRLLVAVVVVSRRAEDIEDFLTALEGTGAFAAALSRTEEPQDDGTLRAVLQAYYTPAAVPAPPASESPAPAPGNKTPATAESRDPFDGAQGKPGTGPSTGSGPPRAQSRGGNREPGKTAADPKGIPGGVP